VSYDIRDPLEVQFVKTPAIAIAGASGSGKTESAMRLARGYVGPTGKFLVVDTEEKRALYKRDRYQPWDWMDFQPPFAPENYAEVLDKGKSYQAVVLDSGSHEYFGEGGLQDIANDALERMCKGDMSKAERLTAPSWKSAKMRHKSVFMNRVTRYPALLIVCLRAEPKIKFVKVMKDGREQTAIVDAGYQPICEKMFMYEMLVGAMMMPDNPGVPVHIKKLEPDLEPVFISGEQITEKTGERLALWSKLRAAGGRSQHPGSPPSPPATSAGPSADRVAKVLARFDGFTQEQVEQALGKSIGQASKTDLEAAWEKLAGAEI
jgi:hypothetical protein